MRPWIVLCAAAAVVALLSTSLTAGAASPSLPPLPAHWPATLQLGMADSPGGAPALRRAAPFGFRYQYLAGGVNTGSGWATWNPAGSFVTRYDTESWAAGIIPVYSYYQLLQSKPAEPGGEDAVDLAHLDDPGTMAAYWSDVRLFFQRAHGSKPVVLHVEPDLWGYIEQASRGDNAATVPAVVPGNLPQTAAGFAQEFVQLRDALAPNVILAYHMSGWGTKHDIVYEKPPPATVRAYAARSAAFYRSLGAHFDVAFEDFSDRDAGYYQAVAAQPEHVVQAGRLRAALALRLDVRAPGGDPDGGVADPAREHRDARREQHERPLPGQPRPVAARPELAGTPARVCGGRLRRLPLRPRRRRQHLRLRRSRRRCHESGADRRQHHHARPRRTTTAATSSSRHAPTTRPARSRSRADLSRARRASTCTRSAAGCPTARGRRASGRPGRARSLSLIASASPAAGATPAASSTLTGSGGSCFTPGSLRPDEDVPADVRSEGVHDLAHGRREDVDAADDEHVVGPPDASHPRAGAAALARGRPDLDVIAGAEPQERRRALPKMRQDELARRRRPPAAAPRPTRARSARRGRNRARRGASRPAPRTLPRAMGRCRRSPSPRSPSAPQPSSSLARNAASPPPGSPATRTRLTLEPRRSRPRSAAHSMRWAA